MKIVNDVSLSIYKILHSVYMQIVYKEWPKDKRKSKQQGEQTVNNNLRKCWQGKGKASQTVREKRFYFCLLAAE